MTCSCAHTRSEAMAAIAPPAPALPLMTLTTALFNIEKPAFIESLMALMFNHDSFVDQRKTSGAKHIEERVYGFYVRGTERSVTTKRPRSDTLQLRGIAYDTTRDIVNYRHILFQSSTVSSYLVLPPDQVASTRLPISCFAVIYIQSTLVFGQAI